MQFLFQLAHGADPFLKNQEGQAPVDLSSADDVRCLLQDAMASQQAVPTASSSTSARPPSVGLSHATAATPAPPMNSETVIMPSGASMMLSVPMFGRNSGAMSAAEGSSCGDSVKSSEADGQEFSNVPTVASFLQR